MLINSHGFASELKVYDTETNVALSAAFEYPTFNKTGLRKLAPTLRTGPATGVQHALGLSKMTSETIQAASYSGDTSAQQRFPGLRPEALLLLCAASPLATPARSAQLRSAIKRDIDWQYLFDVGAHNEVLPLLYWSVNAACPELVPEDMLDELRKFFRLTSFRNLHFARELVQLIGLFNAQGIEAIPYKGPTLAQNVYRHIALRSNVDLDILVRPRDVELAAMLLQQRGYSAQQSADTKMGAAADPGYHAEFQHRDKGIRVEIHWDVVPRSCGDVSASALWDRAVPTTFGTQKTLTLAAEDMFVVLCVHHGAKHEWDRLKWIADVGWMIETWKTLDWRYVFEYARALNHEREVLTGCLLASSLFGVAMPATVIARLRAHAAIRARAGLIRGRLFRSGHGLPGYSEWLAYMGASDDLLPESDGFGSTLLRYLSAIMTPEFRDRHDLALPAAFASLRYAFRPLRLFTTHRSALFKRLP